MQRFIVAVTFVFMICLSCASTTAFIPAPEEGKCILIGSIILEIDGYKNQYMTVMSDIEVAIVGRYYKDGREKSFGSWTVTDENGYFCIPNVPPGDYAIRGIQYNHIGTGDLQIINELLDPERDYYELNRSETISLVGLRFDVPSFQNVINMKHNILHIYGNELIDDKRLQEVNGHRSVDGFRITQPSVPLYFIDKLQGSGWEQYLNMQL